MGLLNAQQTEPEAMPDQAEQPGQPQNKDEETYKRLGLAMMTVIYTKPESDHVLKILQAGKDRPADAVAQAAFAVIKRLQVMIKGIDPKLAFSVAPPLVALIFEMGMTAEIFTEDTFPKDADPQKLIGESLSIMAELERGAQPQGQQGAQAMPPQGQPQAMPQQSMGV